MPPGMPLIRSVLLPGLFVLMLVSGGFTGEPTEEFSIQDQQVVVPPENSNPRITHWLFIECDYWAGCYMPCRGTLEACLKVAHDARWTVLTIHSRVGDDNFEADSMQGPVPLPSEPEE